MFSASSGRGFGRGRPLCATDLLDLSFQRRGYPPRQARAMADARARAAIAAGLDGLGPNPIDPDNACDFGYPPGSSGRLFGSLSEHGLLPRRSFDSILRHVEAILASDDFEDDNDAIAQDSFQGGFGRGHGRGVAGRDRGQEIPSMFNRHGQHGGANLAAQIQENPQLAARLASKQNQEIDDWHEQIDGFRGGIGAPRATFGRGGFGRGPRGGYP